MTGESLSVLKAIGTDRRQGAAAIAADLITWGEKWGSAGAGAPGAAITSLTTLARAQSALAPVLRIANDFLIELERRDGADAATCRRAIAQSAEGWRRRLAAARDALSLHLRRALESVSTIYTYSASSSVQRALEDHAAAGQWFRVVCSEGRPGGEGTAMAAYLARRGIPVRLGTDVWLWGALEEQEGALVLGADALMPVRWINKLGTGDLAERARAKGLPVLVAADTSKWLPPALAALPRAYEREPTEILRRRPAALEAVNPGFEEIPYAALDLLITERGPTRARDLHTGEVPVARALR
ncbi:MAG: hypothetical protein ABR559_06865 [Gemmatimonadota bacterium]